MRERTTRNLLKALGLGDYQATLVMRCMFWTPAGSDPRSPHVMVLVGSLQDQLNSIGAGLMKTATLDVPTANAIGRIMGDGWEHMAWVDVVSTILDTVKSGWNFRMADMQRDSVPASTTFSGLGRTERFELGDSMPFGLPDVPGGLLTYGVAAFLLYRYLKHRQARP